MKVGINRSNCTSAFGRPSSVMAKTQCACRNRFGFELQVREVKKVTDLKVMFPLPYVSDGPYLVWGTGVPTA